MITEKEKGILAIVKLNEIMPRHEIRIKKKVIGCEITFTWNSKNNLWGRFGGGWNWELGFVAGGRTIIFNLLICTLRIELPNAKE